MIERLKTRAVGKCKKAKAKGSFIGSAVWDFHDISHVREREKWKRLTRAEEALRRVEAEWRRTMGFRRDVIAKKVLIDGAYYIGHGRNADIGRWDERSRCFWVISISNWALNPATYPLGTVRNVRLKREDYYSKSGGTFKPFQFVYV